MTESRQRLANWLYDILESIDKVGRWLDGVDEETFYANDQKQEAVVHRIALIGEASAKIAQHFPDFPLEHPELPLSDSKKMRDRVIHGYPTLRKAPDKPLRNVHNRLHCQPPSRETP